MRTNLLTTALIAFAGFASIGVAADLAESDRSPLESALRGDLSDGRLDDHQLVEAALIAGGVDSAAELQRLLAIMDQRCAEASQQVDAGKTGEAAAVLEFLHQRILTGPYQAACFAVDRTLDSGRHNCVTATVLFNALCESLQVKVVAVAGDSHVFSRLAEGDRDVETTCASWFEHQREDSHANGRLLDDPQLLGKIYFNRGLSLLEGNDYPQAVYCLRASCTLDPHDAAARRNLCAALNNWALYLADAGRFQQAVDVLMDGIEFDRGFDAFRSNDLHIHHHWATALCEEQRYADAIAVLETGFQRRPEASLFDDGRLAVYHLWAADRLDQGRIEAAADVFRLARRHLADRPEMVEIEIETIDHYARRFHARNQSGHAISLVRRALRDYPDSETLKNCYADLTSPDS